MGTRIEFNADVCDSLGAGAMNGAPVNGSLSRRNFLRLSSGVAAATALEQLAPFDIISNAGASESGQISAVGPIQSSVAGHTTVGLVVVSVLYTPEEDGYWVLVSDGTVISIDAPFHGHRPALVADEHVAAMASTPTGDGYWLFTSLGYVHSYGAAVHMGDLRDLVLAGPIVDAVSLPDGSGYYLLGNDGGIFTFGAAAFHGSIPQILPGVPLVSPVNGLVPHGATGYWLIAGDGGLFSFGSAPFVGSVPQVLPGVRLAAPVVGALASGSAYLMVAGDGGIFNFGDSVYLGSRPAIPLAEHELRSPVTAVDVLQDRSGYLMVDEVGMPWGFGASAYPRFGPSTGPHARHTHDFIGRWPIGAVPYRWASDEPIRYVINNDFGPADNALVQEMIMEAVAEVEVATGLTFLFVGTTTEYVGHTLANPPDQGLVEVVDQRDAYQPARYGETWAPVWIGARPYFSLTSTVGQASLTAHLEERITGVVEIDGILYDSGEPTWITGTVAFHWDDNSAQVTIDSIPRILRHELGHLVGLHHARDSAQVMYELIGEHNAFASGDLLGLHLLGNATRHPAAPGPNEGFILPQVNSSTFASTASAACRLA